MLHLIYLLYLWQGLTWRGGRLEGTVCFVLQLLYWLCHVCIKSIKRWEKNTTMVSNPNVLFIFCFLKNPGDALCLLLSNINGNTRCLSHVSRPQTFSCHPLTTNVSHLPCVCLPPQNHWGLHKGSGAFFLTVTLKWYWPWLGLPCPRAHVAYYPALLTSSTPAVVARELHPPHRSPSLCVPAQAQAAQAECTGHTSLSVKVKQRRWDQYDQMRCRAKTKPSRAFHLLGESYMDRLWQGDFKMIKDVTVRASFDSSSAGVFFLS